MQNIIKYEMENHTNMLVYDSEKKHTCQVSGFWGSLRILHPVSPFFCLPLGGDEISLFFLPHLRIYVLFHLKLTR